MPRTLLHKQVLARQVLRLLHAYLGGLTNEGGLGGQLGLRDSLMRGGRGYQSPDVMGV